jgi:hypothetical protein
MSDAIVRGTGMGDDSGTLSGKLAKLGGLLDEAERSMREIKSRFFAPEPDNAPESTGPSTLLNQVSAMVAQAEGLSVITGRVADVL